MLNNGRQKGQSTAAWALIERSDKTKLGIYSRENTFGPSSQSSMTHATERQAINDGFCLVEFKMKLNRAG
jgi:hypothetical protein